MKQKNPPKSEGLTRKLISTVRSITTRQVELPVGILKPDKNLYLLKQYVIEPFNKVDLQTIKAYHAQIINFPIGDEKLNWEPKALQVLETRLNNITVKYQPQIMEILTRFLNELA